MRVAFVAAALSLVAFAAGCGGHAAAPPKPCSVAVVNPDPYGRDLVAGMPDGSFVVGTTYEEAYGTLSLVLWRVDSSCHPVRSWGANGTAFFGRDVNTGPFGEFDGST